MSGWDNQFIVLLKMYVLLQLPCMCYGSSVQHVFPTQRVAHRLWLAQRHIPNTLQRLAQPSSRRAYTTRHSRRKWFVCSGLSVRRVLRFGLLRLLASKCSLAPTQNPTLTKKEGKLNTPMNNEGSPWPAVRRCIRNTSQNTQNDTTVLQQRCRTIPRSRASHKKRKAKTSCDPYYYCDEFASVCQPT